MALRRAVDEKGISISMHEILEFLEESWHRRSPDRRLNGRDIRNAVQSAVALAEEDQKREGGEVQLTRHHLQAVLRMLTEFDEVTWFLPGFEFPNVFYHSRIRLPSFKSDSFASHL